MARHSYDLFAASYDAAVRDALPGTTGSQPVLFVFSAGNDGGGFDDGTGGNPDTILSPATAKNVITVGALEQLRNITNTYRGPQRQSQTPIWKHKTDTSFQVAGFSSRGNVGIGTEGTYGRFKPDVVAPGSFVVSTRSSQWDQYAYYNPTNYAYNTFSNQIVYPNTLTRYSLSIPPNTIGAIIFIQTNRLFTGAVPDQSANLRAAGGFPHHEYLRFRDLEKRGFHSAGRPLRIIRHTSLRTTDFTLRWGTPTIFRSITT